MDEFLWRIVLGLNRTFLLLKVLQVILLHKVSQLSNGDHGEVISVSHNISLFAVKIFIDFSEN